MASHDADLGRCDPPRVRAGVSASSPEVAVRTAVERPLDGSSRSTAVELGADARHLASLEMSFAAQGAARGRRTRRVDHNRSTYRLLDDRSAARARIAAPGLAAGPGSSCPGAASVCCSSMLPARVIPAPRPVPVDARWCAPGCARRGRRRFALSDLGLHHRLGEYRDQPHAGSRGHPRPPACGAAPTSRTLSLTTVVLNSCSSVPS